MIKNSILQQKFKKANLLQYPMADIRQHQEMGYDRSVGMFSPDGLLLQVEYAEKAVNLGSPVLALTTKEGVVFIADKRIKSKLLVKDSFKKIISVDNHLAITGAGVMSDGRRLIEQAQIMAQEHRIKFQTPADILSLVKDIANIQQHYSQAGGLRPFGVSLLVGGIEDEKPSLYQTMPGGIYLKFHARCVGEKANKINDILEETYKENMSNKDAIKLGLNAFKKVQDDKFDIERFEVSILGMDEKLSRLSQSEIKKLN